MADNKQSTFTVKPFMDTSALDRQVDQLKQKLSKLTQNENIADKAKSIFGDTSPMGQSAQRAFHREREANIRALTSQYKEYDKVIEKVEKRMEAITKQMEGQTAEQQKQSQLTKDQLARESASAYRAKTTAGGGLQQMGIDPNTGQAIVEPQQTFFERMRGRIGGMSAADIGRGLGRFGGTAGAGLGLYGSYLEHQQTRDREVLSNIGRATQAGNIGFQQTMQGRGFMNFYEQPERRLAMQTAMSERETRLQKDPIQSLSRAILKGLGGAGAGAIMGGGIPGAIIGGGLGIGQEMFGNKGTFRQLFDREAYKSEVNAETMQNFRSNLLAGRMADPTKFAAAEVFGKNQKGLQQLQRRIGMGDEELFGGQVAAIPSQRLREDQMTPEQRARAKTRFNTETGKYEITEGDSDFRDRQEAARERNRNRGRGFLEQNMIDPRTGQPAFSQERIMGNMNQILQAGGSTEFVSKQFGARQAAQFQQAGMTGAGAELGALSGLGFGKSTVEEYKKILGEGVEIGVVNSGLPEESRRFAAAAIQIMTQTEGARGAVQQFAAGVVGTDQIGMKAAQGAFQSMNVEAGQGGGYRGALKWAFMNSDKGREMFAGAEQAVKSGKMSGQELEDLKGYFSSANLENLDINDPMVKYAAQMMGKTPEEVLKDISTVQKSGLNFSERADEKSKEFNREYKDFLGKDEDTAETRKKFMESERGVTAFGKAFGAVAAERGDKFSQQGAKTKMAAMFMRSGEMDFAGAEGFELPEGGARTLADKGEASRAKDQMAQLSVLNDKMGELGDAMDKNVKESLANTKAIVISASVTKALTEFLKSGGKAEENLIKKFFDAFSGGGGGETGAEGDQPNTGN